jgi:hypothetical protein
MVNMKRTFLGETFTRKSKAGSGYKTKSHAKQAAIAARKRGMWVRVVKSMYKGKVEYHLWMR